MRNLRLDVLTAEGWRTAARRDENCQRLVRLETDGPVTARALRVVCEATWGDERAHLFEVRAYRQHRPTEQGTP